MTVRRKLGCNKKSNHLPQHSVSASWNSLIYRSLKLPHDVTVTYEFTKRDFRNTTWFWVSFQTFSFSMNKLILRKMKMFWLSMSVHALLTVHGLNKFLMWGLLIVRMNILYIVRERFVASLRKEFSKVINIDEKEDCLTN